MRNSSWGPAGRGDIAVGDAQWDAVGDGISGSSNAGGSGSGNGSDIAGGGSEGPMTPEPDRVKESARAARARARAAVGKKHEAELRELDWLDQQAEQALSSPWPNTPALAAELGELERELNRVQLRCIWQHADVHMEATVASTAEEIAEA